MKIRSLGKVSNDFWLDVARRCPYATYFHTPVWAQLMATVHPRLSLATRGFQLCDGARAVLPLLSYDDGFLFRGYESMAPGVYGGPIAERLLTDSEVNEILDSTTGLRIGFLRVFGNPFLECFRATPDRASDFTQVIDLRAGFESVFRRFHRNHRRSYEASVHSGLSLDRASSLQDFRDYYAVYRADRVRWGQQATTDDPLRLFEEIHRREDPNVVLWLARWQSRVVAGDLWLYWNRHNVGWHGAADPEFFDKHPTHFLLTEIIRDACARGAHCLDLNPSGGHSGVVGFKESFGAERIYFRHANRPASRLYFASRRLARKVKQLLRFADPTSFLAGGNPE